MKPLRWSFVLPTLGLACSSPGETAHISAETRGQALFEHGLTNDAFVCATCHRMESTPEDTRVLPGADLGGVTLRPSFWGGAENDLLRAIGNCQTLFMGVRVPLAREDPAADDLYAFLDSHAGSSEAWPFTVARTVTDLPAGDADRGAALYARACGNCHGETTTGAGALGRTIPRLPDDVLVDHAEYEPSEQRLVFVEKVRHGGFLGYGGDMPPYSLEALDDAALSDILSALGLDEL